jgi:hypothetical protein
MGRGRRCSASGAAGEKGGINAMLPFITPQTWLILGPLAALTTVLLALAALGLEPALRALAAPEWPPSAFRFTPRLITPPLFLVILLLSGASGIVLSVLSARVWLLFFTPLAVIGGGWLTLRLARARYRRQLDTQVLLAVTQLAGKTSGSAALLSAFREIGRESPWPLCAEWAWIERHLNVPYEVTVGGRVQTRFSDHAYALRCLAAQTPLDAHARVLDAIALIYEQGAESHASARLRQLDELLHEHDRLRRDLTTQFGRVRNQAFIIAGAMGAILLWLLASQTERVYAAFVLSPFGLPAALWFGFWLALPVITGVWLARPPDLSL